MELIFEWTDSSQDVMRPEGAVMFEPAARACFPDSEAANKALRGLITLLPQQSVGD